ncbi:MAG: DUF1566 domain-containing protein [Bacteroidales bacterium]|nr:DUF1566 domain-containing protein [Bacteroidales bacterium]
MKRIATFLTMAICLSGLTAIQAQHIRISSNQLPGRPAVVADSTATAPARVSSVSIDTVRTAQLQGLLAQRQTLRKQIGEAEARRDMQLPAGSTPESQEEYRRQQDSLCLCLKSQLTDIDLQIGEFRTVRPERPMPPQRLVSQPAPQPEAPANGSSEGHEWVDLGLSVKWATCNVGAGKAEDSGTYLAWGEKAAKESYAWADYADAKNDRGTEFTTYGKGGKTVLDKADDVARQQWGGAWRMPTRKELEELKTKCSWTFVERDGQTGYEVKGPNGHSIFLPAAGCRNGKQLQGMGSDAGYWSVELDTEHPNSAWSLYFNSKVQGMGYSYRHFGRLVRAVVE